MKSTIDERLNELEKKANSEFVTLSDLTAITQELDEIDPVPKTKELPQDVSLYIPDISEAPAGKIFKTSIRKVEVEAINFDEEFREDFIKGKGLIIILIHLIRKTTKTRMDCNLSGLELTTVMIPRLTTDTDANVESILERCILVAYATSVILLCNNARQTLVSSAG